MKKRKGRAFICDIIGLAILYIIGFMLSYTVAFENKHTVPLENLQKAITDLLFQIALLETQGSPFDLRRNPQIVWFLTLDGAGL